jgi:hypothetical protein
LFYGYQDSQTSPHATLIDLLNATTQSSSLAIAVDERLCLISSELAVAVWLHKS